MPRFGGRVALTACALLVATLVVTGAEGQDRAGMFLLFAALPLAAVLGQLLLAAVAPRGVRRLAGAVDSQVEATIGWGVFGGLLIAAVTGLLAGAGGQAGQVVAGLVAAVWFLVAALGASGLAYAVGRWCLARDGFENPGAFAGVMVGGFVLVILALVPFAGVLVDIACFVLGLGAIARATVGVPQLPPAFPPPAGPPRTEA